MYQVRSSALTSVLLHVLEGHMKHEMMADLTMMAMLSYRTEGSARDGAQVLGLGEFTHLERDGTTVIMGSDERNLVVAFRGTDDTRDVLYDADFSTELGELGTRVHAGFRRALDAVWDDLRPVILASNKKVYITGHSLGGALAILLAARLASLGHQTEAVVTLGQPRVGKGAFSRQMNFRMQSRIYRVINYVDPVTRVPLALQGFRHPGRRWYFDSVGVLTEDASALRILFDDWRFRVRRLKSTKVLGLAWHNMDAYVERIGSLGEAAAEATAIDTQANP
jgi:pimeloyl-ACP methyl ester carboxylesterase